MKNKTAFVKKVAIGKAGSGAGPALVSSRCSSQIGTCTRKTLTYSTGKEEQDEQHLS